MIAQKPPFLFEVAWEVCNQIGGIHTVIKSKVPAMVEWWGEHYHLIGPYEPESAALEFEEGVPDSMLAPVLKRLRERGLVCHYGRWLVPGKPRVLLFDYRSRFSEIDRDKYFLWTDNNISTPPTDYQLNDTIAFGFILSEFFAELVAQYPAHRFIAHFHEWMAAVTLLRIAHQRIKIATVFTTHATLLGRYIASDNPNFYRELDQIDPEGAAAHYNINARFQIERAAAHCATVFTTISDVTAREATRFLQRTPEYILPNGLNIHRFTALHEFQNLHLRYKEQIHEFTMGHFFPYYTFDLDRTIYFFISGRYEYRNKGMDLFIEAIHRLNQSLKQLENPPTVVCFLITRGATRNINVAALQNHLMFEDLKHSCIEIESGMGKRLVNAVLRGRLPSYEELLSTDHQVRLKRAMHALKRNGLPAIVTHDMVDDNADAILRHIRYRGLFNAPNDPVKVVFHPDFLSATNPLFNMDYEQFVRGCHLGVFPSYYEPWGYTPLECMASGIPAVTTDLSGFGSYIQRNILDPASQGVYVLPRAHNDGNRSIEDLCSYLNDFLSLSRRERIELRNRAEHLSDHFDWSQMSVHYHDAHQEALGRVFG